jgi:Cdc6-like AAA superfamily ATPase
MHTADLYDKILNHLLLLKKDDSSFTFWLRSKGERLKEGNWFHGTKDYISIGLVKLNAGNLTTKSISIHIDTNSTKPRTYLFVEYPKKDQFESTYQDIIDRLELEDYGKIYSKEFTEEKDLLKILETIVKRYIPIIRECVHNDELEAEFLISNSDFNRKLNKIKSVQVQIREKYFREVLIACTEREVKEYYRWLDLCIEACKIQKGDPRIVFSLGSSTKRLIFTVGKRMALKFTPSLIQHLAFFSSQKQIENNTSYYQNEDVYLHTGDFFKENWNPQLFVDAVGRLLDYHKSTAYMHNLNEAFESSVFDLTYRDQLFQEIYQPQLEDTHLQDSDMKNLILYGPPGTGKTHELRTKYFPAFTSHRKEVNELDLKIRVRQYTWWQVIAAALYIKNEGATVPNLAKSKLISSKHRPSINYPEPNHILWNILQKNPELFEKNDQSIWIVNKQHVDDNYPMIKELHGLLAGDALTKLALKEGEKENYKFITFHQSFAYEDFIEGIKPVLSKENEEKQELNYELGTGLFYDLCLKGIEMVGYESFVECYKDNSESRKEKFEAIKGDKEKQVAIFIDEINRGNVSAIFGELITLIEDDKRIGAESELWAELPYSKDKFGIPPNLYIIGTMNTADRSVEALDTALRRRFSFKEMLPEPNLLSPSAMYCRLLWKYEKYDWKNPEYEKKEKELLNFIGSGDDLWEDRKGIWDDEMKTKNDRITSNHFDQYKFDGINLKELLVTLNDRIEALVDRDHTIGHAFFMKVSSLEALQNVFANNIIPLLQEYFYGDYTKMEMVIGPEFFNQEKRKKKVVFAVTNDDFESNPNGLQLLNCEKMDANTFKSAIERLINKAKPKVEETEN